MAKCEDCICFKSCQAWCVAIDKALKTDAATEELQKNNAELCPSFKNIADVVEVVRCRECKHLYCLSAIDRRFYCKHHPQGLSGINIVEDNPFCSYGERSTDNANDNP